MKQFFDEEDEMVDLVLKDLVLFSTGIDKTTGVATYGFAHKNTHEKKAQIRNVLNRVYEKGIADYHNKLIEQRKD